MKLVSVILLLVLCFALGAMFQDLVINKLEVEQLQYKVDYIYDYTVDTPMYCTVSDAELWLARAAKSHVHHLVNDNPDDDEFHQGCIDRYNAIICLIHRLELEIILRSVE